ncbi:MAG TPA: HYR domain-containing protein, partial [Prolixibacteraceae bacterium]|nr:HYR domain-containing protein [Prolixibacteraceae bacterium]
MKNLYKSLKLKYLTAVPIVFMLLLSTTVQGQTPLTGSVDVTFTDLNGGGDAGSDFEYFQLNNPVPNCGVVYNVQVEVISDNTQNGTYAVEIRTPDLTFYTLGSSYNLGGSVYTLPDTIFDYSSTNWTIWAYEDGIGGPSSATFRITYEYNLPYVTCKDFTLDLDAGDGSLSAGDITNETIVCGTSTAALDKTQFTASDEGENTVTLTVTDENLVQATCEATVTVIGVTECKDTTLQLDAAGVATLAAADLYIGEDADISPVSISQTDFACSDVGDVAVTLTMEDGSGTETTCISTVTVADTLKPMAMCMDTIVQLDESGNFALTVEHVEDGSTDNCGIATSTVAPNTFNTADLGENTVTLTVTDNSGNVGTCEAVVTIKTDKDAVCKDTTLYIDNSGAATLAGAEADLLVSTNVENYTLALETADFSCVDIGEYRNALYVTNAANDSAICYSMVTVKDTTPPMVTCTDLTLSLDANGDASIVETDIVTASSDNCGIAETLLSQTAFNCNATGENLVTVTVTDNNGNQTTCSSTVTVNDDTAPTALCKDITIQLDDNDSYSLEASEIDNGSSDNCG